MRQNAENFHFGSKLADQVDIVPLGGGCEVGRSCILIRFRGKTVMLDCGLHPADNDFSSLPYFDRIDPAEVDLLLVTHFHLDHCGSVPYFLERTGFRGKTVMTYPTKAIYKHLLLDSLKVGGHEDARSLYGTKEIMSSLEKIKAVNFHEEMEFRDIKFTAYNAGHVIGAAMFIIEIGGTKILYTGDYSREEDMHIIPAEIPKTEIDILIVESTYGTKTHEPRDRRQNYFLNTVEKIVRRNGKCLLPVFVLGRAQELLLMLENHWAKNEDLQTVPIYYASTLMGKCMLIFQTYINMMGRHVKDRMKKGDNPFDFKFIKEHRGNEAMDDSQKSMVVMASPGMLQKGLSRTLFQRWCSDERNGVVFTGYCVENTLAYDILHKSKKELERENGQTLKIRMTVEYVSFSAHADMAQTKEFIELVKPKLVVLVHGEKHEAMKLKRELESTFGDRIEIKAPQNWEFVHHKVAPREKCKLLGHLVSEVCISERDFMANLAHMTADLSLEVNYEVLFFRKNNRYFICKEEDSDRVVHDKSLPIRQKLHLKFRHSMQLVKFLVPQIFPTSQVRFGEDDSLVVNKEVTVRKIAGGEMVLEWLSGEKNDIVGDCLGYFLYELDQYEDIDMFHYDPHDPDRMEIEVPEGERRARVIALLSDNFGMGAVQETPQELQVNVEGTKAALLDSEGRQVLWAANEVIRERVGRLLRLIE